MHNPNFPNMRTVLLLTVSLVAKCSLHCSNRVTLAKTSSRHQTVFPSRCASQPLKNVIGCPSLTGPMVQSLPCCLPTPHPIQCTTPLCHHLTMPTTPTIHLQDPGTTTRGLTVPTTTRPARILTTLRIRLCSPTLRHGWWSWTQVRLRENTRTFISMYVVLP